MLGFQKVGAGYSCSILPPQEYAFCTECALIHTSIEGLCCEFESAYLYVALGSEKPSDGGGAKFD